MRNKLLYILPLIAGLNGISLHAFNLNIRLDQLLAVILCVVLFSRIIIGKQKFYLDLPGKFLLAFLLISFFSSYFYSPDRNYSIIQTINILSAASVYFLIPNLLTNDKIEKKFLKSFVFTGIIMCGLGIFLFIIARLGITDYGVNLRDDFTVPYGVYSTMFEPNIFGSYSVIYFLYSLNIVLLGDFTLASKKTFLILLAISAAGLLLSFTRGAWLASIITIILSLIVIKSKFKKKHIFRTFTRYLIGSGLVLFLISDAMTSKGFLSYKIDNFLNASSGTGYDRLQIWAVALGDIANHPLLGNGTYSFAAIYAKTPYSPSQKAWIGNFLLTVIHDTGIIGATLFLSFLSLLILRSVEKPKLNIHYFNTNGISLSMASVAMLIAFFFTTGFSLCYSWIPLGLISYFYKKQGWFCKLHD